jgi:hypothetical protein
MGGAISQAVSRRPTAAKARGQTKGCEICGGQSGCVIPPLLHTHRQLHVALTSRANTRSLETFQKAVLFRK